MRYSPSPTNETTVNATSYRLPSCKVQSTKYSNRHTHSLTHPSKKASKQRQLRTHDTLTTTLAVQFFRSFYPHPTTPHPTTPRSDDDHNDHDNDSLLPPIYLHSLAFPELVPLICSSRCFPIPLVAALSSGDEEVVLVLEGVCWTDCVALSWWRGDAVVVLLRLWLSCCGGVALVCFAFCFGCGCGCGSGALGWFALVGIVSWRLNPCTSPGNTMGWYIVASLNA